MGGRGSSAPHLAAQHHGTFLHDSPFSPEGVVSHQRLLLRSASTTSPSRRKFRSRGEGGVEPRTKFDSVTTGNLAPLQRHSCCHHHRRRCCYCYTTCYSSPLGPCDDFCLPPRLLMHRHECRYHSFCSASLCYRNARTGLWDGNPLHIILALVLIGLVTLKSELRSPGRELMCGSYTRGSPSVPK